MAIATHSKINIRVLMLLDVGFKALTSTDFGKLSMSIPCCSQKDLANSRHCIEMSSFNFDSNLYLFI